MSKLMDEVKRLEEVPIREPWVVLGNTIVKLNRPTGAHSAPVIRDNHAGTETLELFAEALNWLIKKKALMDLLARHATPETGQGTISRGSQTTSAAGLTRLALQLGTDSSVFSETAANLRALETKISLAFVRDFDSDDFNSAEQRAEAYKQFRAEHIQALLED